MKIPERTLSRITAGLRKYRKVLAVAKDRDINESDTVVIVADILSEVLGFDKYTEVTTELGIRGTFCDLAVKVDGKPYYLLEVKAIGLPLRDLHLRQAINYAANNGVEWVALTNAALWHVYKMRFEKPIQHDAVFKLDLLSGTTKDHELVERLYLLSKEGIAKSAIQSFHEQKEACSPFVVGAALLSDPVLQVLRRELRRASPGARVEPEDLRRVLMEEVLKRDVVEGEPARAAVSALKRALRRRPRPAGPADLVEEPGAAANEPPGEIPE